MLYAEKIENHKLINYTPFEDVAKQVGYTVQIEDEMVTKSDIDGCLYEKEYCPMKTEEDKVREEAERIGMLNLTAADVERGIYATRKMDFEDVINKVIETGAPVDIKALKIELRANHFYRANPFVDQIGTLLGFSKEQLDRFFETKDPQELVK